MSWAAGTLAAFDTETTGLNVETDRIVTACVARVSGAGAFPHSVASWLANPGVEIPESATRIHGVTTNRARAEGEDAEAVIAEVTAMLARAMRASVPVVGFNLIYDLSLLDRECRRYGLPTLTDLTDECRPVVCARVLDKQVSRRGGSRKLVDCCKFWNVALDGAHNSTADAIAAAGVVVRIAQRSPAIAQLDLVELHARQIEWHREQCLGLADYFRRRAADAPTVDDQLDWHAKAGDVAGEAGAWPVKPFEQQGTLA